MQTWSNIHWKSLIVLSVVQHSTWIWEQDGICWNQTTLTFEVNNNDHVAAVHCSAPEPFILVLVKAKDKKTSGNWASHGSELAHSCQKISCTCGVWPQGFGTCSSMTELSLALQCSIVVTGFNLLADGGCSPFPLTEGYVPAAYDAALYWIYNY